MLDREVFLRFRHRIIPAFALLAALILVPVASAQDADSDDNAGWPREFELADGSTLLVYQPQVERWEDFRRLDALAAVIVTLPREAEMIGALEVSMTTATDHQRRLVTLRDPVFTRISFPSANAADAQKAEDVVRRGFPSKSVAVSLDRIVANLQRHEVQPTEVEVRNDPPKIILSEKDAILVRVHGEPLFEPIGKTGVSIVVNTISDLFRDDATGHFYLMRGKHWLEAPTLEGPWTPNRLLPKGFFGLPDDTRLRKVRAGVRGRSPDAMRHPPDVHVVSEPTELIVMHGRPEFEKIPGTKLSYVANSESDIFRYEPDRLFYALFSGRWFRTPGSGAPLEFCTNDLPEDFAQIAPDHAAGRVLVSIPGTDQAREAMIASQIPHTAKVDRLEATFEASYLGGEPEFASIPGCVVEYVVNTSQEIFRVNDHYYACQRAVWFESDSPHGPWAVCDEVPDELYEIPSSSPHYAVTNVFVYDSTADDVTVGYLPGYEDLYIADGVYVYGLGLDYNLPMAYYRHRHTAWTDGHYRYLRLRDTYGHGYYYDHLSGRYRRSREAREHQAAREIFGGPYESWGETRGVQRSRFNAVGGEQHRTGRPMFAGSAREARHDLYATREGQVYRRADTGWQQYGGGGWSRAAPARARHASLVRASRGRHWGVNRRSQYQKYRSTRGELHPARNRSRLGGRR
ncbi:MAG: hypothetical protein GY715_05250 [Planctomycetes bacterium]|nr:hypothetical protein [Planctomycetota bacterium]